MYQVLINILCFISFPVVFCLSDMRAALKSHSICRGGVYPGSHVKRFLVPDDKVAWEINYAEYLPPVYNSMTLKGKPFADPDIGSLGFLPKWNEIDGQINRKSFEGAYKLADGYPMNPRGRTGIIGHGLLGRWGPNHAADPIVTRWKRDEHGDIINHSTSNKPILQLVVVQRKDNREWALPGGMVDPGEKVAATAVREFYEEATNSLQMTDDEKISIEKSFKDFFSKGEEVTFSYVDDPRNTDNCWMETTVYSFHDETGDILKRITLNAGDDAMGVKWLDINRDIKLYASHKEFVEKVVRAKHCYW